MNKTVIYDAFRRILGRGFKQSEVDALELAFQQAAGDLSAEVEKGKTRVLSDSAEFFDHVRKITGRLSQEQVDSILLILTHSAAYPIGWVAYILATAWHESRFIPQEEWGKGKGKKYGQPGKYGQSQHGRGFVQLTWDFNYEWADKALNLDGALLRNFDLALTPSIAARILVQGMVDGAFTGKGLSHYIGVQGSREHFRQARKIVNGRDKESLIAGYAVGFQEALVAGHWG